MKKIFIPITICAFSTLAMAKFVSVIPSDSSIQYSNGDGNSGSNPVIPDSTIRCTASEGVTRAELIALIDGNKDVTSVCTSNITDFSELFSYSRSGASTSLIQSFNQDIGDWDVSNGTDFSRLFDGSTSFNQNIGNWDVSAGTTFFRMFTDSQSFNQDITKWDVSSGQIFEQMFNRAYVFDQDIHFWNVKNANNWSNFDNGVSIDKNKMPHRFGGNAQDLDSDLHYDHEEIYEGTDPLDSSSVPTMKCLTKTELQELVDSGYRDLRMIDTSCVTDFSRLFYNKTTFNQDISRWNVSNGTTFKEMFLSAEAFNQDIGSWNVSKGTNFYKMFENAKTFNQDIGLWDISSGVDFFRMFTDSHSFNQDIGAWDVSSGKDFGQMFNRAYNFDKDIHFWNVQNATSWSAFKSSAPLTTDNTPCKFGGNCSLDTDSDSVFDHDEVYAGTDPLDPASL